MNQPSALPSTVSGEVKSAIWHTSTYSGSVNACVEHGRLAEGNHAVRDTKDRARGTLTFAPASWQTFIDTVRTDIMSRV